MISVAVLYICIGKYKIFWKDFFLSSEELFLKDCKKCYYVFTDAEHIFQENNERVFKIDQKNLGWPNNTLMRFHFFDAQKESLKKYDYLFFMNANCLFVDEIKSDEFLPLNKELLFVDHPIFYNKENVEFTYDRNPNSKAYIPIGEGVHYICGGVNGGKSRAFLKLTEELRRRIDSDTEKGIVALWHDESHINRYAYEISGYKLISPSYFYPEGWTGPFVPKILVREKTKYFDVDKIKDHKVNMKHRIKHLLRRLTGRMIRF